MNAILDFVKKSWLVLLLAVALLVMAIMYFSRNSETVSNDVMNAPAPAALLQSNTGLAEAAPSGSVLFCIRLDGRQNGHLPALIGGGPDAYGNGHPAGFNWGLMPTATGSEDYGVMPDGTVFCKVSFLTANGMTQFAEYIGNPAWVPIKMSEANIDGQPALVYKLPNF